MVHFALLLTLSIASSAEVPDYGNPRLQLVEVPGELPKVADWPAEATQIFALQDQKPEELGELCETVKVGTLMPYPTDRATADRLYTLEVYEDYAQAVLDAKLQEQQAHYQRALEEASSKASRKFWYGIAGGVAASAALVLTLR